MSYPALLNRLYALSPKGIALGLDRVRRAAGLLGNPQAGLACVQVAGTNGKGTVSSLVAHLAGAAGLSVGLYTSPHLHRFAERIRISGREANEDLIARHLERVFDVLDRTPDLALTFFEVATLTGLCAFEEAGVDLAVLEVGLGGRLDATTIALPKATAVTSIGIDHTEYLGGTLALIAAEKAAIARSCVPLVVGKLPDEALRVVRDRAKEAGAPLFELGRDFGVPKDLVLPWPGEHQRQNAAVALKLVELLGKTDPRLSRASKKEAMAGCGWPCRFEVVDGAPRYILDGAHNLEAVEALVQSLGERGERLDLMIFGALQGKPTDQMLAALRPCVDRVLLVAPPIARALDPAEYAASTDRIAPSVGQGLEMVEGLVPERATVLVTGSLFTAAEARRILLDEPSDAPIGL